MASAAENRPIGNVDSGWRDSLRSLPALSGLRKAELELVVQHIQQVKLPAGYALATEDIACQECFLVIDKAAAVKHTSQGDDHCI